MEHKIIKRPNPIGINYYTLDVESLQNLGYKVNSYPNWSEYFNELIADESCEHRFDESNSFLLELFIIMFGDKDVFKNYYKQCFGKNPSNNVIDKIDELRKKFIKDDNGNVADWMLCVPNNKYIHNKIHELLKESGAENYYEIVIMNGNNMTNKQSEHYCVCQSKHARNNNKSVIFITGNMGTRSWSNPYVKNCAIMLNEPGFDSTIQKWARTWTTCFDINLFENIDSCALFDFRFTFNEMNLFQNYIYKLSEAKDESTNRQTIEKIKGVIQGSNKINFYDVYFDNGINFKKLSSEEIGDMLSCKEMSLLNFKRIIFKNDSIVDGIIIPNGYFCCDIDKVANKPKGDSAKKQTNKDGNKGGKKSKISKTIEKEKYNVVFEYLKFIVYNAQIFNWNLCKKNIVIDICNTIKSKRSEYEEWLCMFGMEINTVESIFNKIKEDGAGYDTDVIFNKF